MINSLSHHSDLIFSHKQTIFTVGNGNIKLQHRYQSCSAALGTNQINEKDVMSSYSSPTD